MLRRPISVRGSSSGTRWDRSPAAMAPAVVPISSRGRSPRRTSHHDRNPRPRTTASVTMPSTRSSRPVVLATSESGIATINVPVSRFGPMETVPVRTRNFSDDVPIAPTVNGVGCSDPPRSGRVAGRLGCSGAGSPYVIVVFTTTSPEASRTSPNVPGGSCASRSGPPGLGPICAAA